MEMRTLSAVILCVLVAGLLSVAMVSYGQQDDRKISVNLVDADIRDALTVLFRGTDKNFVLTEGATAGTRITVKLDGVDFETALQLILQQAGLQHKVAGNVYTISPAAATGVGGGYAARPPGRGGNTPVAPPASTHPTSLDDIFAGGASSGGSTYETTTAEGAEKVTTTIKILYGDATEIAQLFGGQVAQGRFSSAYGGGYGGYSGMYGGFGGFGGSGSYGGFGGYGSSGSYGSRYGGYGGYGSYGSGYGGYGSYGSRYSGSGSYGSRYGSGYYGRTGY
jgi:hypothetical protein